MCTSISHKCSVRKEEGRKGFAYSQAAIHRGFSQICSIKDSTKGTYVWLFASLASSLYVNGEKSTLYKGLSFSGSAQWHLWDTARLFQQQRGRRAAEGDEIFMLIVAKLPTKDYKRHVMRSCQAWGGAAVITTRNQSLVHGSAPVPDGGAAEGRSPL